MTRIVEVISNDNDVTVTLDNGLVLSLCPNDKYVHLGFSGLKGKFIEVKNQSANYLDIGYHRES